MLITGLAKILLSIALSLQPNNADTPKNQNQYPEEFFARGGKARVVIFKADPKLEDHEQNIQEKQEQSKHIKTREQGKQEEKQRNYLIPEKNCEIIIPENQDQAVQSYYLVKPNSNLIVKPLNPEKRKIIYEVKPFNSIKRYKQDRILQQAVNALKQYPSLEELARLNPKAYQGLKQDLEVFLNDQSKGVIDEQEYKNLQNDLRQLLKQYEAEGVKFIITAQSKHDNKTEESFWTPTLLLAEPREEQEVEKQELQEPFEKNKQEVSKQLGKPKTTSKTMLTTIVASSFGKAVNTFRSPQGVEQVTMPYAKAELTTLLDYENLNVSSIKPFLALNASKTYGDYNYKQSKKGSFEGQELKARTGLNIYPMPYLLVQPFFGASKTRTTGVYEKNFSATKQGLNYGLGVYLTNNEQGQLGRSRILYLLGGSVNYDKQSGVTDLEFTKTRVEEFTKNYCLTAMIGYEHCNKTYMLTFNAGQSFTNHLQGFPNAPRNSKTSYNNVSLTVPIAKIHELPLSISLGYHSLSTSLDKTSVNDSNISIGLSLGSFEPGTITYHP